MCRKPIRVGRFPMTIGGETSSALPDAAGLVVNTLCGLPEFPPVTVTNCVPAPVTAVFQFTGSAGTVTFSKFSERNVASGVLSSCLSEDCPTDALGGAGKPFNQTAQIIKIVRRVRPAVSDR